MAVRNARQKNAIKWERVKPVCHPCCYPCCSEIKPKLTAEPLTLIWTHLEYEIKPRRPLLSACAADGCTTRPCMSRLTRPVRTSAVNFPALSRFAHSSSPLNESANHPMQPTSQTMLYVWHGKIMLGYFRCRGRLRLNQYSFIKSSTFPSELRMSGLESHFFFFSVCFAGHWQCRVRRAGPFAVF